MMKPAIFILLLLSYLGCKAQTGGKYAYEFLDLVSSPMVAALGGKYVSLENDDLSLVYHNPSVLNDEMDHHLTLNYVNYYAGINYGYISYAHKMPQNRNIAFGIQYINYGRFTSADETGNTTGHFTSGEYAYNFTLSQHLTKFLSLGIDVRPILSIYETYVSVGLSTDYGITYQNPEKLHTFALVVRNFGSQIKAYDDVYEHLPFEVQAGFTQKLRYAPFRISLTAQHLETPDLSSPSLVDPNENLTTDENKNTKKSVIEKVGDNFMRHLVFGIEFIPARNFYIRAGYNYQRRQELRLDSHPAGAGFSWGFGLSVSRLQINFARANYHVAGSTTHIGISTDLSTFYKKKNRNVPSS
jgi:hypothetical protein